MVAIKGNDMSICQKIQDLEIDTQDIWKDDILNRKEVAEDFTRILSNLLLFLWMLHMEWEKLFF